MQMQKRANSKVHVVHVKAIEDQSFCCLSMKYTSILLDDEYMIINDFNSPVAISDFPSLHISSIF